MFSSFGRTTPPEHMVKMLRESEPNAAKRMMKFLDDYEKCTSAQRDQVFVPANEDGIVSLFVGAVAVFKKHHSKSKQVAVKDVKESLRLLDLLRERSPRALENHWEAIRIPVESFLDESIVQTDIKTSAFCLLFWIVDTSMFSEQNSVDSSIAQLYCKSFHWPNSYRLRVEPSQPCEFLTRSNQLTENWDAFSLLFEKMVSLILESRSNNESKWWLYMKEKILTRFPLSLSEKPPGAPLSCPVAVAACLIECVFCELVHLIRFYHIFFFHCLMGQNIIPILATTKDLEIAMCVFYVVMTSAQNTTDKITAARSKCVALLERWVCNPLSSCTLTPLPFQEDMDRWLLCVARCTQFFFHSWKDVKGLKNEQDMDTAIRCISVIELISRVDINAESWKSLFRLMLDVSHSYLAVTEEQKRGDASHPPDKVLSCIITDGVFALLLRRVTPPEFWEELRHRERGIAGIFHFHTTIDSWTRVLLVIAQRLVMHMSSSHQNMAPRLPDYLHDHDQLTWRIGGRPQKCSLQASPWQHRVDTNFEHTESPVDQRLQPFFSLGSPWFPIGTWSKSTDCCRAWDRLICLIPPKKKIDKDFSITLQALDAICEWFLDVGVLPSTCLQYFISWLRAAFELNGDPVPSLLHASGPSHFEVALSVAIGLYKRIILHQNYPISHEDPFILPLLSVLQNKAFNCDSVIIQVEAFDTLTQLLHVIPHSVSFLVPMALASKIFTKKYIQTLIPRHQIILCRFMVSVVHAPGYFGKNEFSQQDEMWNNLLSALHEMLHLFQDFELFSQLMWSCWLVLSDASTSSNTSVCNRLLSEISDALVHFSASNSHIIITLEVIRATAVLIPSFIDQQQHSSNQIHQILLKLSHGLSSKINQSSISKMAEQNKNEYFQSVNFFICTIREWLVYCISRIPQEVLDHVYEALIVCLFDGTNIYKQLQAAMEVQPTDWSEVSRIISSRHVVNAARSGISVSAEVCLCSLSSFMPTLSSLSLAHVTCEYASSLCKTHPHISLSIGRSRILTFVEDQSTWGQVWVVARDTTGIRLWSAQVVQGDDDTNSSSVVTPSQGGGPASKIKSHSVACDEDPPPSVSTSPVIGAKKVEDHKDPGDTEVVAGDPSSQKDVVGNDDEIVGGVPLLNDEDFTRPPGKLALFQKDPHSSRVEMLGHLLDYINESISSSSVALEGSQASSRRLIQLREQEHAKLSLKLKSMLQEEHEQAAQRKANSSPLFDPVSPPPVADKRLWKLQFTQQLVSSLKFVSNFTATSNTRLLSAADELNFFEDFDKLPSRENLTVMLSLPLAGSSRDSDEFLASLKVNSTRISDSEFFLSSPDRDFRFVVSSGLPPAPEGRWTSPAHVQFLWQPRDGGRFDRSTVTIPASCYCIILQPIGANLILVQDVLLPDGESTPMNSAQPNTPFLRGCVVNVNIVEPMVLACAISLSNHGDLTQNVVYRGSPAASLLKRRFDILDCVSQKYEASQSFFDVANTMHTQ